MKQTARWLVSGSLILALSACADSPSPSPSVSEGPCQSPSEPALPVGDSVVVSELDAPCTIEFREVARLVGPAEGPDPREPVAVAPGGTFVTSTHDPGQVAIWSARGEFLRTVGEGPGEGPGEFPHLGSLLVDADSTIHILPGNPYWHRYSWSGAFLETVRTPTAASTIGMTMAEDETLITPAMTGLEPGFFAWPRGADRVRFVAVEDPFRTERDPALGFDFTVGDGLLWVLLWMDAPDAPSTPRPEATSEEERRAIANEYRNAMIEVLTPDGRLAASRTSEDIYRNPRPITADRWYLVEDEPVPTLVILEPNLVER